MNYARKRKKMKSPIKINYRMIAVTAIMIITVISILKSDDFITIVSDVLSNLFVLLGVEVGNKIGSGKQ